MMRSKIEINIMILQACRRKPMKTHNVIKIANTKPALLKELVSLGLLNKQTKTRTLKRRPSSWRRIGRNLHLLSKNPPMVSHDYYTTTELGIKALKLWEELELVMHGNTRKSDLNKDRESSAISAGSKTLQV
jgi:predicted transcriptional regulator